MSVNQLTPIRDPGCFSGRNFMTPDVRGYYKVEGGYAELSKGSGFNPGSTLYGVTVRRGSGEDPDLDFYAYEGETKREKLSRCFHSSTEAYAYIESVVIPPRPKGRRKA